MIFNRDERINIVFSGYERRNPQSRNKEWLIRGVTAIAQDLIDQRNGLVQYKTSEELLLPEKEKALPSPNRHASPHHTSSSPNLPSLGMKSPGFYFE